MKPFIAGISLDSGRVMPYTMLETATLYTAVLGRLQTDARRAGAQFQG